MTPEIDLLQCPRTSEEELAGEPDHPLSPADGAEIGSNRV